MKIDKVCLVCGTSYTAVKLKQKYCSKACKHEMRNVYQANYRAKPDKAALKYKLSREWVEKNRETVRQYHKIFRKKNLAKDCAKVSNRRARKINATPVWADKQYMLDVYENAREFEGLYKKIGIERKLHVDHIVPLNSDVVCGLHCEFNLQVLEATENIKKSNKFQEPL